VATGMEADDTSDPTERMTVISGATESRYER
jgi:hypothetical protein